MTTSIRKLNVVVIASAALLLLTIASAQAATIIEDDVEGNGDKSAITGKITKAWAGWNGAIRAGDRFGQHRGLSAGMNADKDLGLKGTAIEVANGALVHKDDTSIVSVTYGGLTQVGAYTISLQMHQFGGGSQIHTVDQFKFAGVGAAGASSTPPAKLASGLTTPGQNADEVFVLTYNVATAGNPLKLTIAPNGTGGAWGIDHVQIDFVVRAKDSVGSASSTPPAKVVIAVPNAQAVDPKPAKAKHVVVPAPRDSEKWWLARQAKKSALMVKGDIVLLMVGDSITDNFESVGAKVWEKYFVPLKAINLGFGGDRTEHVLWRLNHLPKLKKAPKGAVVMIGTNNICWGSDTPKQAADGVQAIARKLNDIYPETKILVLGVFPRRRYRTHPHRKQIVELNSYLPELLKDMKNVTFKDIGPEFLARKGYLSPEIMPDTTHPSEKGHEIWAKAIQPELKKMLGK